MERSNDTFSSFRFVQQNGEQYPVKPLSSAQLDVERPSQLGLCCKDLFGGRVRIYDLNDRDDFPLSIQGRDIGPELSMLVLGYYL